MELRPNAIERKVRSGRHLEETCGTTRNCTTIHESFARVFPLFLRNSSPVSTPGFTRNFSRLYHLLQNFDELGDCRGYLGLFFPNRGQFELTLKFS